jgi:signal transduction histidine kinase
MIPIMSFDPLRIRQACVNLLNNAVKFSPAGSTVTIRSRNGSGEAVVSVMDSGPGIGQDELPKLFEKFTQLDGGASREKDGLGIGLKLVKHYVELHGGRIWVESEAGRGSTFSFSIPRRQQD